MRTSTLIILLAGLVIRSFPHPVGRDDDSLGPNVTISSGPISGNERDANGCLSYKGIPYAAPPIGELRWKSPQRPVAWKEVRQTKRVSDICYAAFQIPGFPIPQSEDCLSINVWTTAKNEDEKRPVMLWIHGGGFEFGTAADPRYDGTNLAIEGVVVASINYRLGVFGYLALPELDKEGHNSGDFGIQDQILALKWVHENIEAFGGDPHRITVFGESGGAHAIGILMASPLTKGLFHGAILESGAFWDSEHGSMETFDQARATGAGLFTKLEVSSVEALRALPADAINKATQWNPNTDPRITAYSPSVDDYILKEVPSAVFSKGKQLKIPTLAGFNAKEELVFFTRTLPYNSIASFLAAAQLVFHARTPEFLSLYPATTQADVNASALALNGDLIIREQTWEVLDYQYAALKHHDNDVYAYYFTYSSPFSPVPLHTAEFPFSFGNLLASSAPFPSAADRALSKTMMSYWTNFAKYGNPNGPDSRPDTSLPFWPDYGYSGTGGVFLELGNEIKQIVYDLKRFRFIQSFRVDGVLPNYWATLPLPGY